MREVQGNLWDYYGKAPHVCCIPINQTIKKNGRLVMGRGVAAQAKHRFRNLDLDVAVQFRRQATYVFWVRPRVSDGHPNRNLLMVVTKNRWWQPTTASLLTSMLVELRQFAEANPFMTFILPRPGCGNGGMDWPYVRELMITSRIPDNVWVIHNTRRQKDDEGPSGDR